MLSFLLEIERRADVKERDLLMKILLFHENSIGRMLGIASVTLIPVGIVGLMLIRFADFHSFGAWYTVILEAAIIVVAGFLAHQRFKMQ